MQDQLLVRFGPTLICLPQGNSTALSGSIWKVKTAVMAHDLEIWVKQELGSCLLCQAICLAQDYFHAKHLFKSI